MSDKMVQTRASKVMTLASGQLTTTLVNLVIAAVLSRMLTKTEYATYTQAMLTYQFLAPLLALGLPQALYYFIPRDSQRARGILVENLILLSTAGVLFGLFLLAGGNELVAVRFNNPALAPLLLRLAPYPMIMLPLMAVSSCLMAQDRPLHVAAFNMTSRLLVLMLVLIAVTQLSATPTIALTAVIVAMAISLPVGILLMFRATRDTEGRVAWKGMGEQLKYAAPMGLASMIGTITLQIDKVIVSSMVPAESFAIYVNGAIEVPLMSVITGSIMAVLLPEMVRLYQSNRATDAIILWGRAALKSSLIIFPVTVFLFIFREETMVVLFSESYRASAVPFAIYLLLLPIRIVLYGAAFMAAGRSDLILKRALLAFVVNILFSILLVHFIGYVGAAIGSVLTMYIWIVPYNFHHISKIYQRSLKRVLPFAQLGRVALFVLVAGVVPAVVAHFTDLVPLMDLAVNGLIYCILVLVLYIRFGLLSREDLRLRKRIES